MEYVLNNVYLDHKFSLQSYEDDGTLRRQFGGSGLHMAIVFPGEGDPDPESVAVSIAKATSMNYAFVIMPDRYEV